MARRLTPRIGLIASLLLTVALIATPSGAQPSAGSTTYPDRLGIGTPATHTLISELDIDVSPDGTGLPEGSGTAQTGAATYRQLCASCHGPAGEGGTANRLVGRGPPGIAPFGADYDAWRRGSPDVPFTVGSYWPYATTLFDYIRRAMPTSAPGSLSNDDVYGLVAWILAENEIIAENSVIDATTLPRVEMPARDLFVPDDRQGGPSVR